MHDPSVCANNRSLICTHNRSNVANFEERHNMAGRNEVCTEGVGNSRGESRGGRHARPHPTAFSGPERSPKNTRHNSSAVDHGLTTRRLGTHASQPNMGAPHRTSPTNDGCKMGLANLEVRSLREAPLLKNSHHANKRAPQDSNTRNRIVPTGLSTNGETCVNGSLHSTGCNHSIDGKQGKSGGNRCFNTTYHARGATGTTDLHGPIPTREGGSCADTVVIRLAPHGDLSAEIKSLWDEIAHYQPNDETKFDVEMLPWSSGSFQIRVRNASGKLTFPRRPVPCTLPLGQVAAATLNVERIRGEICQDSALAFLLDHWITGTKIEPYLNTLLQSHGRSIEVSRHFDNTDEETLEKICDPGQPGDWVHPAFKVAKKDNTARFIHNLAHLSDLLRTAGVQTPPMGLPDLLTLLTTITCFDHVATIDATSFFFQIALHPRLRKYFGIRIGFRRGKFKLFRLRVLPMGLSWSPSIAQHLALFFVEKIRQKFPQSFATVWVDNFIICAKSKTILDDIMQFATGLFEDYGLRTKTWETGKCIEVLGFNVTRSTSGLTISLRDHTIFNTATLGESAAALDVLRFAGKLIFANYALIRQPLATLPTLLDILREASTKFANMDHTEVTIPPALHTEIHDLEVWWKQSPTLSRENAITLAEHPLALSWSDASTSTIAVVHETAKVDAIAVVTHENLDPKRIYLLELLGIYLAARTAPAANTMCREIVTDSQIAQRALLKGHTCSSIGNKLIACILQENAFRSIRWVNTLQQRADPLTRGSSTPLLRNSSSCKGQALIWRTRIR